MNKKIKINLIILITVLSIIFYIFSIDSKNIKNISQNNIKPEKNEKVKIANLPIVQGLPVYLAKEKGYFEKAGIDVEIINFQAPNQIVDALLNNQVDFVAPSGAMGIFGIVNYKKPGKIKIYAAAGGTENIQNDSILVKKNSKIMTINDLNNKKLGILPGIQWRTVAKYILEKNNLELDSVTLVELAPGLQGAALATGQIDALLGVEPIPTIIKTKEIGDEIIKKITVKNIANPFYGGGGAVSTDFINKKPETVKKVLKILEKSIKEINENPDKSRQYLKKYTPLNDEAISIVPISKFKMYNNFTEKDIEAIQKFYDIFSKYKVINGKMNFRDLIY